MKKLFLALLLTFPMLAMDRGQEDNSRPCIYLVRSGGGFSPSFVAQINKISLGENDKVARCKKTDGNNLDLFRGKVDCAFFRIEKQFLGPDLKSKNWTAQPTSESLAVLDKPPRKEFVVSDEFLRTFCRANGFQKGEWIDAPSLKKDYQEATGITYNREVCGTGDKYDLEKSGYQPSLGFIAISHLHNKYQQHKIVLVDFNLKQTATFNAWDCHWWEKEDEYAKKLERAGYLVRLMDDLKKVK